MSYFILQQQGRISFYAFFPRPLSVVSDWHISALMIATDTWSPIASVAPWGCIHSRGWSFTHLTKAIRILHSVRALVDVATVCSYACLKMNRALTHVMWPVVFAALNHQLLLETLQAAIGYNRAIGAHWHPHARHLWSSTDNIPLQTAVYLVEDMERKYDKTHYCNNCTV